MQAENSNQLITNVMSEYVTEQRRKRRWTIFFKLTTLAIIILIVISFFSSGHAGKELREKPHTAVIKLNGVLMAGAPFDADRTVGAIEQAYKYKGTKGIILRINSPGGSPVQADYIYNAIMRLRKEHPKVPIYSVCSDICASGAYFVASATQKIYANPASLVGSIGVIMEGFGFTGTMQKLGVSRRVTIAGKYKDFMDPFSKQSSMDKRFAQSMVDNIHQQFIDAVEKGRGKRLHKTDDIFSGMAWTGQQAMKLGLIDGYGSTGDVARDVLKEKKMLDYTIKPNPFQLFANKVGASFANVVLSKFTSQVQA